MKGGEGAYGGGGSEEGEECTHSKEDWDRKRMGERQWTGWGDSQRTAAKENERVAGGGTTQGGALISCGEALFLDLFRSPFRSGRPAPPLAAVAFIGANLDDIPPGAPFLTSPLRSQTSKGAAPLDMAP